MITLPVQKRVSVPHSIVRTDLAGSREIPYNNKDAFFKFCKIAMNY